MKPPEIHLIVGPTASGKSALALELAEKLDGVIINADSQQMYKEFRVLTARPGPAEEARAPHRLYGALSADEPCSAGKWLRFARMEIDWALGAGKTPLVTGGTGLYLKALMEGIADIPDIAPEVRAQAKADMEAMGREAFHARLSTIDPGSMVKIRTSDTQRMLRAWEVFLGTGKPLSWWHQQKNIPIYAKELFSISHVILERRELYARCDARVVSMINQGGIKEVENILTLNLPDNLPAMRIIGVPELGAHLRNEISLGEAIRRMQQATRHYAKRQMTWFRHQLPAAAGRRS